MSEQREPLNLYFRLVVVAAGIFIMTIFAMVATVFGDEQAPVNQFLNEFGGILIGVEVAITLILGFAAMSVDRRRTLRAMQERIADSELAESNDQRIAPSDAESLR